ncbi:MAG: hypothetical protein IPM60_08355 [Rhodospirillales bacterium]|nr:hypothetical protein [Rhodospirillales bacterium]
MVVFAAVLAIALFIVVFRLLRVVAYGSEVLVVVRRSTAAMTNKEMDDDAKEAIVREATVRLLGLFVQVTVRSAVAVLVPTAALFALQALDLVAVEEVVAFTLRWYVIVIAAVAMIVFERMRT